MTREERGWRLRTAGYGWLLQRELKFRAIECGKKLVEYITTEQAILIVTQYYFDRFQFPLVDLQPDEKGIFKLWVAAKTAYAHFTEFEQSNSLNNRCGMTVREAPMSSCMGIRSARAEGAAGAGALTVT
jgi:hypothetical protein